MILLTAASRPRLSTVRTSPPSDPVRAAPWSRPALAALLACGLASAVAQTTPPQLPPGAEPGRGILTPVMPQPSLGMPRIEVPRSSAAEAPPGAKEAKFALRELLIEGVTAFPADALRPLYAGLLGREVTVAEVFEAANAIELRYRNAGYVTSRVIVPQQTVADGRFRIVVVEGFVADLVYQGDIGPARAAVERLMGSLRGLRPVTLAAIERRLLLANDLPGITVRGTLEPAPGEVGGSLLVVRVERRAMEGSATLDNRGSPYLGGGQFGASLAWNGLGDRADRLSLNARSSMRFERSHSLGAGYDALVTDAGGMLGLALSHARSKPGRELEALDVRSRVSSGLITFTHPLLRGREENLRAMGQLEVRDVSTDIAGTGFTRDRLRIVRAGLSYDRSDRFDGITTVRGTLHQGLSGLGASANGSALASRVNGRSNFTKLTLDLTRLQQLGERTSLVASLTGQLSRRPLLASEEIGLGGASFGRAFDDGEVSSDNGMAATLELRHVPVAWSHNVQFYGYVDAGRVWAADGGAPVTRPKLASAGGGVRTSINRSVFATLEIAKPINTEVRTRGDKNARAFVTVTAQF